MYTIRFSVDLPVNTFQIDDKDLTNNNMRKKNVKIFKMDDAYACLHTFVGRLASASFTRQSVKLRIIDKTAFM